MKRFSCRLIFGCLSAWLLWPTGPLLAQWPSSLDVAFETLKTYDYGRSNAALVAIEQQIGRLSNDPAQAGRAARRLATLLAEPQTSPAAKLFICQQLRMVGGEEQVPVLAKMLADPESADMARLALQGMASARAGEALLAALGALAMEEGKAPLLLGLIDSLGERREAGAVVALSNLMSSPQMEVAASAARALGKIGTPTAGDLLREIPDQGSLRPGPALRDAQLLCAQRLAAAGHTDQAADLYRHLHAEGETPQLRLGALGGLARVAPEEALPLLVQALQSEDSVAQGQAAALSARLESATATEALARALPDLSPPAQRLLLDALARRGDTAATPAVSSLTHAEDPAVCTAAIRAMASLGQASDVEWLLQLAAQESGPAKQAAQEVLGTMPARGTDVRLLAFAAAGASETRRAAMRALAQRDNIHAAPVLQRAAADDDAIVKVAAFEALATLACPATYSSLVDLLVKNAPTPAGTAAKDAVIATGRRLDNQEARVRPVLAAFPRAEGEAKSALLRVLGDCGGTEALSAVRDSLRDSDATVKETAVRVLAAWPEESAANDLLTLAQETTDPAHRAQALRGYLRLAQGARQDQVDMLRKAAPLAGTAAEKKLWLGALGGVGSKDALDMAVSMLNTAAVREEAAVAAVKIGKAIAKREPAAVQLAMVEVEQSVQDPAILQQAAAVSNQASTQAEVLERAPYNTAAIAARREQVQAALPSNDRLLAYLDCGVQFQNRRPDGILIRLLNGRGWHFGGSEQVAPGPCGTVAFDQELRFEIGGLQTEKHYAVGLTWWDYDAGGRVQTIRVEGDGSQESTTPVQAKPLPNYINARQKPAELRMALDPKLSAAGRVWLTVTRQGGPNTVVSELWLAETKSGGPALTETSVGGDEKEVASTSSKAALADLLIPPAEGTTVLLVTGVDYPGHPWRETAPTLQQILERDPRLNVRIVEDPNALASTRLKEWDSVILHFQTWEVPGPGPEARENLKRFVQGGKGLMLTHFACGAWYGEWPEFKDLAGRAWFGPDGGRQHDPRGWFRVEIADPEHPVTKGMKAFDTTDELYTCLTGDAPIHVVAKATSKVDQKDYPMAFVMDYGKGRVFHTVLGHDALAYTNNPGVPELMRRGCAWAAGLAPTP